MGLKIKIALTGVLLYLAMPEPVFINPGKLFFKMPYKARFLTWMDKIHLPIDRLGGMW